eukprot:CAMPEP_0179476406 /NCGR_PEP_ID=MMETSP0799-20121207/55451_1 /TAXON_ID=46947 /ORGANISM="Geminigera cryophila, Strain CCMP2564" /LENGTH=196 /DNA_ID=CAMNT_0021286615 /DNA_START=150 /DNA_END=740 /DNA_ORIENTATION=+
MAQLVGALATVDNKRTAAAMLIFGTGLLASIAAKHLGSSSLPMLGEHVANNKEKRSVSKVACRINTVLREFDYYRLYDLVSYSTHNRLSLLELGLVGAVWFGSDLDCWKWADVVKNLFYVKHEGSLVMEASKGVFERVYSMRCIGAYQEELLPQCWKMFLEMVGLWCGVRRTYGACRRLQNGLDYPLLEWPLFRHV